MVYGGLVGVWWIPTAVIIRLSQPSLAGVGAGAELGKNRRPGTKNKKITSNISKLEYFEPF